MIDSHAHLDDPKFNKDRDAVIIRSLDGGVKKIINVGADFAGSLASLKLAEKYENIFAAIGMHPHCFNVVEEFPISNFQFPSNLQCSNDKISKTFSELKNLARNKKVVAIGEIGLDYFSHDGWIITEEQKENQKKYFLAQLEIAQENNLPVVLHCRGSRENPEDAYDDCHEILMGFMDSLLDNRQDDFRAVFHCYGGSLEFTRKILALKGINFSFTGNITYAKSSAEMLEVVRVIPLEKIMLETDCPYLTPVPHRGKRNEPAYVIEVCKKIAEIKEIAFEKVDEITTRNAEIFFGL